MNWLKSWLARKKLVKVEEKIVARVVPLAELSSADWRRNPTNVGAARVVLRGEVMATMLAICAQETPMDDANRPWGSTDVDVARAYGNQEGYLHCLAKLQSFGILIEEPKNVEMTFTDELK